MINLLRTFISPITLLTMIVYLIFNSAIAGGSEISAKMAISTPKKIIFLGDSITAGYGVDKSKSYPSLIEKKLEKEMTIKYNFVNASISGSTTASALSRFKWQLKGKPTHLVLALGANDGLRGIKTTEIYRNIEKTVKLAKDNNIKVLIAGMKIPPNYGKEYQKEFDSVFENIAKNYKLSYMPFLLKDVGGEKKYNQGDSIHPNEEGHKIIAKNFWPIFKKFIDL